MSARLAALALGVALAVVGSLAVAGTSYTPPAASGGGVEGDGTGVTDEASFRTALGLGTAAVLDTGTTAGKVVALDGLGKLPAVDGSALTGIGDGVPGGGLLGQVLAKASGLDGDTTWSTLGGAAYYEATDFEAADDQLGALADLVWSSGTQVPAFLGASTASLLTVGTGALNIVQLDADSKLPAVDGSALTGVTASRVDVYIADGTWEKPAGAQMLRVVMIGGGGGGGAGRMNSSGSTFRKNGGGGGGGGSFAVFDVPASALGSSVAVTVGQGGAGGAAPSLSTDLNNGTAGTASAFGATMTAAGGGGGAVLNSSTPSTGGTGGIAQWDGATGGTGSNGGSAAGAATVGKGGGAGGGGAGTGGNSSTLHAASAGSAGSPWVAAAGGSAGSSGAVPTAGGVGSSASTLYHPGGGGGGGGCTDTAATAGAAGGDGGLYGGGGGGGGGGVSSAGKGGDGADGLVVVVTYF